MICNSCGSSTEPLLGPGDCGLGFPALVQILGEQKPQPGHEPALPVPACPCGVWQSGEMVLFGERLWGTLFLLQPLVLAALPLSPCVPDRCPHCHTPFPHRTCPHQPSCPLPCVLTSLGVLPWVLMLHHGVWVLLDQCRCQTEAWPHQSTWTSAELPGAAGTSQGSGDRGTRDALPSCSPHRFPSCSQ